MKYLIKLVLSVVIMIMFINSPIGQAVKGFVDNPLGINTAMDELINQTEGGF